MQFKLNFQVFSALILSQLQFIHAAANPLIANPSNQGQGSLSNEESLSVTTEGIDKILEGLTQSQQNIQSLRDPPRAFFTNEFTYQTQPSQTFQSHVDSCLDRGGFLLYDPTQLRNIPDPPAEILIATFNTRLLLGQSIQQAVEHTSKHASDCSLISDVDQSGGYQSTSSGCQTKQAQAICLYSTDSVDRETYQQHKYVSEIFPLLVVSISDNLKVVKQNLVVSSLTINDIGATLIAAGQVSLKLEKLTKAYPLRFNLIFDAMILDQYVVQMMWLVHQTNVKALELHQAQSPEKELLKTAQTQINDQLHSLISQYRELAARADRLSRSAVKIAQLEQQVQQLSTKQTNFEISLKQISLHNVSEQIEQRRLSNVIKQEDEDEEDSGLSDIDFESIQIDDLKLLKSQLEDLDLPTIVNQSIQVWPFNHQIQLSTYYKFSFINFYCAVAYAWIMLASFMYTCIAARMRKKEVNFLRREIDSLRDQRNQFNRPKLRTKRHSQPKDSQKPLLPQNLPKRTDLYNALAHQEGP